jgi:thiol-disulfide isomerase/thioredoxin/parvulin-like peptidyl-prolyl isomerase
MTGRFQAPREVARSIATGLLLIPGLACRGEEPKAPAVNPAVPAAKPRPPGGIVAIVNDDVITQAELDLTVRRERSRYERAYSPAMVEREMPRLQRMVLDQMIDHRLVLQLVKKEEEKDGKPSVTEADVDKEIADELKSLQEKGLRISTAEDFYRLSREEDGVEREELRRNIKERLAVLSYLQRNVFTPHAFVAPQELRNYYQKNLKSFTTPVAISFRQITVPRTHVQAEFIVLEIEKGLRERADFCELARQYDQAALQGDPEQACRLWTKTFEELKGWHRPIREALQTMKKGETSRRIPTPVGFHFLLVEDVIEGTPRSFSEVQEEITRRIRIGRNQEEMGQFFSRLRSKSRIDVFLPPLPPEAASHPRSPPAGDGEARSAVPAGQSLKHGHAVPPIEVTRWVKGEAVDLQEVRDKKVVVLEFWATWCGPSRAAIPHLTELQKKYREDAVIIGVTAADLQNSLEKVEAFVRELGDKMDYTVAFDGPGKTVDVYMTAAGQRGLPKAFIIDKSGKLAWFGHPRDLKEPLEEVLAGTFDIKKAAREHELRLREQDIHPREGGGGDR